MRTFVALEIPAPHKAALASLLESLRPRIPGLRWSAPETIHLTLRFLGDSTAETLAALTPRLRAAATACPAGEVRLSGLGVFPERGAPRILWLGAPLSEAMLGLQRDVEAAAVASGFAPEDKPFRSHLTLGRWRERVRRPELPVVDLPPVFIESLVLYRSELRSPHALHTPLAAFTLAG